MHSQAAASSGKLSDTTPDCGGLLPVQWSALDFDVGAPPGPCEAEITGETVVTSADRVAVMAGAPVVPLSWPLKKSPATRLVCRLASHWCAGR